MFEFPVVKPRLDFDSELVSTLSDFYYIFLKNNPFEKINYDLRTFGRIIKKYLKEEGGKNVSL